MAQKKSWLRRFWTGLGAFLFILFANIGKILDLTERPEQVARLERWIGAIMADPRVNAIAEWLVSAVEFLDQWWVRSILILAALVLLSWHWRPFRALRHRLVFSWGKLLADQVWISQNKALEVLKESPWGRLMEPNVTKTVNVFDNITLGFTRERVVYGMSDTQKALTKYNLFLERTLDSFCTANPTACRVQDGKNEIDEVALRRFILLAIDDEIRREFGDPPKYKVT